MSIGAIVGTVDLLYYLYREELSSFSVITL